jgi:hypothetical protein
MEDLPYKLGTIKLTWINPSEYTILESKMFDSVDEAIKNIPTNIKNDEYMIFKLIKTDGTAYEWKLLPYGNHNDFVRGMKFRNNKFLYYGSITLVIIGAISIVKLIATKLN